MFYFLNPPEECVSVLKRERVNAAHGRSSERAGDVRCVIRFEGNVVKGESVTWVNPTPFHQHAALPDGPLLQHTPQLRN